jgi:hypothetical protein
LWELGEVPAATGKVVHQAEGGRMLKQETAAAASAFENSGGVPRGRKQEGAVASQNFFALLGDDENEDPTAVIERANLPSPAEKAAAKKKPQQQQQQQQQQPPAKLPSKPAPPAEAGMLLLLPLCILLYCKRYQVSHGGETKHRRLKGFSQLSN